MRKPTRARLVAVLAGCVVSAAAVAVSGQGWRFREGSLPARFAPPVMPDASFVICRLAYRSVRREPMGIGWETDYPFAEINLSTRLSELTKTRISLDAENEPNHFVVNITDPELFNCPMTVASDVGTIGFTDEEVQSLRSYLLKGGFLWVDDFWGSAAWEQWARQISRVLPPAEFPIVDIRLDDPLLRTVFQLEKIPQITNIQFWRGVRGTSTSERGADSAEVHLRAIRDPHGRIMVLMSHNTDVADSWEREGEDREFFFQFSPDGYALGIDVVIYAMAH